MKTIYLDTSILLSAIQPSDPHFEVAQQLQRTNRLQKVSSMLAAAELFSVITRLLSSQELAFTAEVSEQLSKLDTPDKVQAITEHIISTFSVELFHSQIRVSLGLPNRQLPATLELAKACQLAPLTSLKTLDNLHIAAASIYSILHPSTSISYLVTGDRGILNRAPVINEHTGIVAVSPQQLIQMEQV